MSADTKLDEAVSEIEDALFNHERFRGGNVPEFVERVRPASLRTVLDELERMRETALTTSEALSLIYEKESYPMSDEDNAALYAKLHATVNQTPAAALRSAPRFTQEDVTELTEAADAASERDGALFVDDYAEFFRDIASRISQHLEGK